MPVAYKACVVLWLTFVLGGMSACSKTPASDGVLAKLPDVALGDFQGILALSEGGVLKRSFANVRATLSASGDRYRITFSGGMPMVPADLPMLDNLLFVVTPGSQQGVYHTVARDGSVEGIHVSTYMTNLNLEVPVGGGVVVYTGRK